MSFKTDVRYRKQALVKLLESVYRHEDQIAKALYADFKKPAFESALTETGIVIAELRNTIAKIDSWARPEFVFPSLLNFPTTDRIYREPYGDVLVIAPWNYPFQLALCPMIAAVAAGNRVVVKPSELTPQTAAVIAKIITETFSDLHVSVVQGGADATKQLLAQRWDYIFFTGSIAVGKIVARAAAENLTPVTLELGGKNPCIVSHTAALRLAAKRIVWGKFLNAGQTCIAPDYVLVQNKVKTQFMSFLRDEINASYGEHPQQSADYARIINTKNYERLTRLLDANQIVTGGQTDASDLYIAPTIIDEPGLESELMHEEIFGPLLPVLSYENEDELETIISRYGKPLSLYVFSTDRSFARQIIRKFAFGGGCINDTVIHFSNKRLPFGGVGSSGIGAYHGRYGFEAFSHRKAVVSKANWLDIRVRYAPYKGKLALVRKIFKWL